MAGLRLWLIVAIATILGVPRILATAPISYSLDPDSVVVGQPVYFSISINVWEGVQTSLLLPKDSFKPLHILNLTDTTIIINDRTTQIYDVVLAGYDSLDVELSPVRIVLDYPDAGADTFTISGLSVKVRLLPVDTTRDIKPPQQFPIYLSWTDHLLMLWYQYWYVLLLLLLLLLIIGGFLLWQHRNKIPFLKQLSPYEKAMRTLEKLERSQLPEKRKFKEFYDTVSDTLRKYLEEELNIPALEMTTSELSQAIEQYPFKDDLMELLGEADLVKFAKISLSPAQAYMFLTKARHALEDMHSSLSPQNTTKQKDPDNASNGK